MWVKHNPSAATTPAFMRRRDGAEQDYLAALLEVGYIDGGLSLADMWKADAEIRLALRWLEQALDGVLI